MKHKNFVIIALLLMTITLSSAQLEIIGGSDFDVVGDLGQVVDLVVSIKNNGNSTLHNVTFETNEHIVSGEIGIIEANQVRDMSYSVRITDNFDGVIKIQGNYLEDIGTSTDSYEINIDNTNTDGVEVEMKNINVYIGDEILYVNHVLDWVELYDVVNGEQIVKIDEGTNYTKHFNTPEIIKYVINRRGVSPITDTLTINVLDTIGYIHNPFDDTEIHLKITPIYEDTLLNPTFTDTEFNIIPLQETEDTFILKNIGNFTAKNIEIDGGDWITFDVAEFDLLEEQQKKISFTIKPSVENTNDTNQSYTKYIKIKGNFPTITQPIEVFVKYAVIENVDNIDDITGSFIDELIEQLDIYCKTHPDNDYCYDKIYVGSDALTDSFDLNITRFFAQELMANILDTKDYVNIGFGDNKDDMKNLETKMTNIEKVIENMVTTLTNSMKEEEEKNSLMRTAIISLIFSGLIVMIVVGVIRIKKDRDTTTMRIRQFG